MKKLIVIFLIIVVMTTLLTGCIGKFKCEACGEETFGIMHKVELLGQEYTICSDCNEELEELKAAFGK